MLSVPLVDSWRTIGLFRMRKSAYKYISSPDSDLSNSRSRSPSSEKLKTASQRGKRASEHRVVTENPAKKIKVVTTTDETAENGKKRRIFDNQEQEQFPLIISLNVKSSSKSLDARTPGPSEPKSVIESIKKSAKIMTRQRAARQNAGVKSSSQPQPGQRVQLTPLTNSLINNRMNLPNSITKKYHVRSI